MSWAAPYIGIDWVAGESDCWAFARRVWREVFHLDVPAVDVDAHSRLLSTRAFASHPEYAQWRPVPVPGDGDAVLMGKNTRASHIGIWCTADGGGVVHSVQGCGVVFTKPAALASMGLRVLTYYRRGN